MKKIVFWVLCLGLVFSGEFARAGMPMNPNSPFQGIDIQENQFLATMPSAIFATNTPIDPFTYTLCNGFEDKACVDSRGVFLFAHMTACGEVSSVDCIKSVWAIDSSGNRIEGKFIKYIADKAPTDYHAIPSLGIPESRGMGMIWDLPGVVNSGGTTTYDVDAMMNGWINKVAGQTIDGQDFELNRMDSGIIPVREVKNANAHVVVPNGSSSGRAWGSNSSGNFIDLNCAGVENGLCYERLSMPMNYRFGFSLSLTKKFTGWFHGRLQDPKVTVADGTQQVISVEAAPVTVPTLKVSVPTSSLSSEITNYLFSGANFSQGGGLLEPGSSGPDSFAQAKLFLPLAKDTATTSSNYWAVRTLDWNDSSEKIQQCTNKSTVLNGIVSTNSLVYASGPPVFNAESQSLDYKLLSPHYEADGKIATGSYDLVLNSKTARCIYGFSSAPVKASVEIVSADGTSQVASSIINEKDGWLTMNVKGFTFSSPTVKVVLSQEAPVATPVVVPKVDTQPVVTPATPSSAVAPVKKTTITCTKGKTSKKVTAIKPTCPSGYKKK